MAFTNDSEGPPLELQPEVVDRLNEKGGVSFQVTKLSSRPRGWAVRVREVFFETNRDGFFQFATIFRIQKTA